MRLSLSSVAIISIFAAGSNAFAPQTSRSTAWPSRLQASSELSGLLSEYSGSASQAAPVAAEKVADVVSSAIKEAPPTPPAPPMEPVAPAEVVDAGMDSLMKAAGMAQDAADQATAAAAAVATKGVAATKAAAAAGTTIAGGIQLKPIIGGVLVPTAADKATKLPFQVDPAKINYDNAYDASARARENLATMRSNFQAEITWLNRAVDGLKQAGESAKQAGESLKQTSEGLGMATPSVDVNSLKVGAVSMSPAVAGIIASLNLKEYGGWYATAFMAIIAFQQRSAGKEEASVEFESELSDAREKASEAAAAAGMAAEGANTAKKLAMKMEKDFKKDDGKALLESSRSKMAKIEQGMMEQEMRDLQAEVLSLRSQLAKLEGEKKAASTTTKAIKTEIEEMYPTKVVVDSGVDEDGSIIELLKAMDEENRKRQAEELEKKREEEAKFVAAQKAKAVSKKMTKGVEAAQAKAEVAKKKATAKKAKKASTKKSAVKKKAVTKKAVTKKAVKKASPISVAPSVKEASPVSVAPAVKEASPVSVAPAVKRASAADDWSSLAESTLKRKTVAQLSEYLTRKGVPATDDSGKSLKKAELLSAVKSL